LLEYGRQFGDNVEMMFEQPRSEPPLPIELAA
jgi:hypothetical protein